MKHPILSIYEMPILAPDRWVPVVPWTVWVYFSLWVYICIPSSLMVRVNELGYYLMGATMLSIAGVGAFYFSPTAVPSWGIDWSEYSTLEFLKNSDASGNACPSLHVAFAVYAGFWFSRILGVIEAGRVWYVLHWVWCVLIIVSTMTTKQHVFVDVVCGAALGLLIFWLNEWLARKAKLVAFSNA
ncbi:MAG: phosphatase PAP2 family protein [Opitutaceae bacterium]